MRFQGRLPFICCPDGVSRIPPLIWAVVSMGLPPSPRLVAGLPGGLAWLPHRLPPASSHASTRGLASSINSALCAGVQVAGLFLVTHCLALKT